MVRTLFRISVEFAGVRPEIRKFGGLDIAVRAVCVLKLL